MPGQNIGRKQSRKEGGRQKREAENGKEREWKGGRKEKRDERGNVGVKIFCSAKRNQGFWMKAHSRARAGKL